MDEEIEITNRGTTVPRLAGPGPSRNLGFARDQIRIDDDFDAPLPEDMQADVER